MLVNIDDETLALFETLIKCDEDREDTINILVLNDIEQGVLNGFEGIEDISKVEEIKLKYIKRLCVRELDYLQKNI
jgi:hypothetical protein